MGDLWQQMIETVVTDEAKTAQKTEEGRLAKRQLRQMRQSRPKRDVLL